MGTIKYEDATTIGTTINKINFFGLIMGNICFFVQLFLFLKADQLPIRGAHKFGIITDNQKWMFYSKCKELGINDLSNAALRQKACLVAKEFVIHESKIDEAFNYGLAMDKKKESEANAQELQRNKEADRRMRERLEKYISYYGIEKRKAMLQTRLERCRQALKENEKKSNYYMSMGKGADPYIVGGIASAIGGVGAGLYAATETSRKNAQHESEVSLIKTRGVAEAYHTRGTLQREEESLINELKGLKYKVVSSTSPQECFEKLSFSNTKITITEAGSCLISCNASLKSFSVLEGLVAVVDGSVLGKVYEGNRHIGTATLVFGEKGIGNNETEQIQGIALFCGKKGGNYSVEYAPNKLWAMEK